MYGIYIFCVCACILNILHVHVTCMSLKSFMQAIETLKSFEKKESKVASTAATNLSFLYFLVSVQVT